VGGALAIRANIELVGTVRIPANLATNSGIIPATDSGFIWPPIPAQFGHPIW